jgi:TetR/AcrR family transcriptional regulator, cholesterol catabolism regulator
LKVKTRVKSLSRIHHKHLQIARAALPLFIDKGYNQTTIREIADAGKISMGLLYKYISSKDDILYLVYKEMIEKHFLALSKVVNPKRQDPIAELKNSMELLLKLVHEDPKKFLFLYSDSRFLNRKALKAVLTDEMRMVQHFQLILEKGVKSGVFDIKDPFLTAVFLVYLVMIDPIRGWGYRKKYGQGFIHRYLIDFCLKSILSRAGHGFKNFERPGVKKERMK